MIFLLFGAGQETTTHLISGGLFALLSHEDQLRQLHSDPGLMPTCVEECLRYVSPVQMTKPRFVTRDVVWQGRQFRRGDMFAGFLAAANCDPAKFEHPHRFDITRHPNPHLSFGTGVHFCLGFQLARAEAAIAFERILARFPDMRLATRRAISSGTSALASVRWRDCLYGSQLSTVNIALFHRRVARCSVSGTQHSQSRPRVTHGQR